MINERKAAAELLLKIEKDGAYSNISVANYFSQKQIPSENRAFISALVYGVLDRKITLDFVLDSFMKSPIGKTPLFTLTVLRVALYQIMYMDKVPDSAAVNEAVKLIKNSGERGNSGFVNAILRNILRSEIKLPDGKTPRDLSIKYSCPLWIVESFIKDYGTENAVELLEESLKPAPFTIKVNTLKTTPDELKKHFCEIGVELLENGVENSFNLSKGIDLTKDTFFKNGCYFVEDCASQMAIKALSPCKNERLLDICAAPGGKSFSAAVNMQNKGEIVSCDLYENRVGLITEGAKRLGIDIITAFANDASVYNEKLGLFDKIICDVPCSGLGVLRRKPDIKYKPQVSFCELEELQYKILCTAVRYLKPGGKILYSTCTLRQAENGGLVKKFQTEYNEYKIAEEMTLMPHINNTDGFYYAVLTKGETV